MSGKLEVDYYPVLEQVGFRNQGIEYEYWKSICRLIIDSIPFCEVAETDNTLSFPWRCFLLLNSALRVHLAKNKDNYSVVFSKAVLEAFAQAQRNSYSNALKSPQRGTDEIKHCLQDAGFVRNLSNNQIENLRKISNLPGAATFSVPGAGKTTEALAYFILNRSPEDHLLVIAPKNAFGSWDEQLEECLGKGGTGFVRLRGKDNIAGLLEIKPEYAIITYDQVARVQNELAMYLSETPVFVFLDESHRIKAGRQAKRADVILNLAHLPKSKLVMSGTPMPQSPKDLLPQFSFLYPSKRVSTEDVVDLIQPIYARTTKEQMGIPPVVRHVKVLEMNSIQKTVYDFLRSEIKRQMNSVLSDQSKYMLKKIGKCVMKVLEFVSNPSLLSNDMLFATDKKVGQAISRIEGPKVEYACRRARELAAEGKKVIIWSSFVQNVELVASRLCDLGAEYIHGGVDAGDEDDFDTREGKIKRFHSDPNCFVLVANPAACSEGISLHKICSNAIYIDRTFNAAHYVQSEDRIHRFGITQSPEIEILECKESIDQVVEIRLQKKINDMAEALNDVSLKADPSFISYLDEEDAGDDLSTEDVLAIKEYFGI